MTEWDQWKIQNAKIESQRAFARLDGMKVRAILGEPPRAVKGHMPFPGHRTMAQVIREEGRR